MFTAFYRRNIICLAYLHTAVEIFAFILLFKVTPGGKADLQGILEGDFIDEINQEPTEHLVHLDAQNLIKSSKDTLKLRLVRYVYVGVAEFSSFLRIFANKSIMAPFM